MRVYISYLKFVFLGFNSSRNYTTCLIKVLEFYFKVFGFLQSIATPLLVLLSDEKKKGDLSNVSFQRRTSSSVLCVSNKSIMSNWELWKVWNIFLFLLLSWRPQTINDAISNLLILKNFKNLSDYSKNWTWITAVQT